jgi:hypothetical protein
MPRIRGTNNRQTTFLRAFRTSPTGPAADQWPSPALLRKWLRRPAFARALDTVLAALRFQTDFHLASAAAIAARALSDPNSPPDEQTTKRIAELLRLAHLRQRFPTLARPNAPGDDKAQVISERQQVYQYGGEDAVKAYDELCALHDQQDQQHQS